MAITQSNPQFNDLKILHLGQEIAQKVPQLIPQIKWPPINVTLK
jgi:hypothetical protein